MKFFKNKLQKHIAISSGICAKAGKIVKRVLPVRRDAAEHDRLAVIALLDADIKIAVTVAGDEELLQVLQRGLFG